MNKSYDTKKYIGIAIFSALAFVVALVCNIIPPIAGFLSLDAKDAVIAIASFIYGPVSAVLISLIAALIEFFTFSTTGWYGLIMNFASSAVFSLTAALIYSKFRNLNGALGAFFSAVIATTAVMLLLNRFVTPFYLQYIGMSADAAEGMVIELLPKVLLPFNFAKSLLNSAIAMLLYKPLSLALKKAGILKGKGQGGMSFNKSSVVIIVVGTLALAVSVALLLIIA